MTYQEQFVRISRLTGLNIQSKADAQAAINAANTPQLPAWSQGDPRLRSAMRALAYNRGTEKPGFCFGGLSDAAAQMDGYESGKGW